MESIFLRVQPKNPKQNNVGFYKKYERFFCVLSLEEMHHFSLTKIFRPSLYTHRFFVPFLTTTTTRSMTTSEEEEEKTIVLLVKLLPEPNKEEHKNLTRFQIRDPRSKCFGKTCVFRDLDKTKTTVADVKRMVERDVGEKVEMLRRGEKNCSSFIFTARRFVSFRFSLSLSLSRARAKETVLVELTS